MYMQMLLTNVHVRVHVHVRGDIQCTSAEIYQGKDCDYFNACTQCTVYIEPLTP